MEKVLNIRVFKHWIRHTAWRVASVFIFLFTLSFAHSPLLAADDTPYLEPGSLRIDQTLSLEGVFHKPYNHEQITDDGLEKDFTPNGQGNDVWTSEWGQDFLTEVATQVNRELSARILFNIQGEYADRFWNPNNFNHYEDQQGNHIDLREAEGKYETDQWYLKGFSGVGYNGWEDKGDLFNFYTSIYPTRDYLGSSSIYGVYPKAWQEDFYLNIAKHRLPQGGEVGGTYKNFEAAVAYGKELEWGYSDNIYGRLGMALPGSQLTFFYKDVDVPWNVDHRDNERDQAYALAWSRPSDTGWSINTGINYEPFRIGDTYQVYDGGQSVSNKTVQEQDGLGGKINLDGQIPIKGHPFRTQLNLEYAGVVAGNKQEAELNVGTDIGSDFQGIMSYTYRRPVAGAIPFLYEGSPDNILNVTANPRGPESPFTVDWTNREASILLTTVKFDPTPGTNLFKFEPTDLALWNMNPEEDAPMSIAVQHRMSSYKSTTDRQWYYDENGTIQWEPAGHTGAWPTDNPLNEFRILGHGVNQGLGWTLGFAGGQSPAQSGLAYSTNTTGGKPLSDYISFEFRLDKGSFGYWGHYGTGMWGPEENIHPFFGESYDRLFGLGISYNITSHATLDLNYLGARQDDDLFRPPTLGSFDEIRTVFTYKFGFLFLFEKPLPPGTRVQ